MNTWKLVESEFDLGGQSKMGSLFAQGNGYMGWRGTFEEGTNEEACEGCYINGFYETYQIKYPEIAYGYPEQGQAMLNVMNPKRIRVIVDGEEAHPLLGEPYKRELDFKNGMLTRSFTWRSSHGKELQIEVERLVSHTREHCAAIRYSVIPVNFSGEIKIISGIQTKMNNRSADNKDPRVGSHLPTECFADLASGEENGVLYTARKTLNSNLEIACAVSHHLSTAGKESFAKSDGLIETTFTISPMQGKVVRLEKYIAYYAQAHAGAGEQLAPAQRAVRTAMADGFAMLLAENCTFLKEYWRRADIEISRDDVLQQGLRFNSFHLLQAAGRDGLRSVSSKGLTGEGYEGHYFWDTEMYVIPALLYSTPKICRSLLEHRYAQLEAARARAREMGHKTGVLFPWRSIAGSECSTFFPAGTAQYHINGAVSLAIKNYIQSTNDVPFMEEMGAEILFETARFWTDIGCYAKDKDGAFCINCVTGPDEYTAIVNNNFYTNRVARENLWYACELHRRLKQQNPRKFEALCAKINLGSHEPEEWKRAGDKMYFPYDEKLGVFLQDDSFAAKGDWDFAGTPKDQYPLLLHFHPLVIYRHKVLKQADTVLADYVLDQYIDPKQMKRDFDYYEPLTTHDSSLSACVYSIVACRVGYVEKAYSYFMRSARTDLDDHQNNTSDGVHIANMAGAVMCVMNGFGGVRQREGRLSLRPILPPQWEHYRFCITFQGRLVQVEVARDGLTLTMLEGEPLEIDLYGCALLLEQDKPCKQALMEATTE